MAGRLRRIAEYAGIVQRDYDDDDFDAAPPVEEAEITQAVAPPVAVRPASVTSIEQHRARRSSAVREMAPEEIAHTTPRSYSGSAQKIADSYKEGIPVLMNLYDMADDDAYRLLDFVTGLRCALDGNLEKLTSRLFLLTPPSVLVTDLDKDRMKADLLVAQG